MKYLFASLIIFISISSVEANQNTTSLDDITLLSKRGLSDKTILIFLKNRELDFALSAKNIDQLLQSGVSENVVQYLLQQSSVAPTSIASIPAPIAPTTYIAAPTVTYVTPYPNYYYAPHYIDHTYSYTNIALQHGFATAYTLGYNRHNRHIPVRHYSTHRNNTIPYTTPHASANTQYDSHYNPQRTIIQHSVLGHNKNKGPHRNNKHPMSRKNQNEDHNVNYNKKHKQSQRGNHQTRHNNSYNNSHNNSHNNRGHSNGFSNSHNSSGRHH